LVDNLLAAHPAVYAAGPLESMNKLMSLVPAELLDGDEDWYSEDDFWDEINLLHQRYTTNLDMFNTTLPVITDSNPMNFRWIGFILAAFPDAAVIHITRDPLATCASIYKDYFAEAGLRFACDQGWIAEYYNEYQELMASWHEQFPGKILDIGFEALTAEPDAEIRKTLGFCGLPWDDACLEAYGASRETSDTEVWRKYDPWLTRLKAEFAG
ncbi:MAG: sulfotransferase, partial [Desulfobacterales bacterium]|nr:sulfotransferase [Desulfobacterales bacterium]